MSEPVIIEDIRPLVALLAPWAGLLAGSGCGLARACSTQWSYY